MLQSFNVVVIQVVDGETIGWRSSDNFWQKKNTAENNCGKEM